MLRRFGLEAGLLGSATVSIFLAFSGAVFAQDSVSPNPPTPAAEPAPATAPAPDVVADSTEPPIACFLAPAKLDPAVVDEFLAKPEALLERYPQAGLQMTSDVRALGGSDNRTVDALLKIAETATPEQRASIGAGLARAALACAASSPQYSEWIQAKVADSDVAELVTAFVAAAQDIETAKLRLIPGGRPGAVALGGNGKADGGNNGLFKGEGIPTFTRDFGIGGGGGFDPNNDNNNNDGNNTPSPS